MPPADLSPAAQLLADHFDIQKNLGMGLPAADELHERGYPVTVARARLTYFSYTKARRPRPAELCTSHARISDYE